MQKTLSTSLFMTTSKVCALRNSRVASSIISRYISTSRIQSQESVPIKTTFSKNVENPTHVIPVNVEAIYYQPLKNPVEHGDLVCDLQLRAYDNENLDFFCDFILRTGYYLGAALTGPKPLPTKRERWTVIKAPFVHAKTKENFERRTHKRLIRVWDTTPEVLDILLSYITKHSVTGVGLKVNYFQRHGLELKFEEEFAQLGKSMASGQDYNSLSEEEDHVSKRVGEILNDPVFKQYMKPEDKKA